MVIAAAAIAAGLIGADRAAAGIARRQVAQRIAAAWRTTATPGVRIVGPFLIQLIGGVYRNVRLTVPAVTAAGVDFTDISASLTRVRAPIGRLLAGGGIVITELSASVAIPFTALNKRLPAGFALRRHRDELQIFSPLVAWPVDATVAIDPDLRHIAVTPRLARVPSLVGFRIDLPAMPPEVTITSIAVTDTTLLVDVAGRDVRLAPAPTAGRPATSQVRRMRPWRAE